MLFLINPFDILHKSVIFDEVLEVGTYYILDTDDFKVDSISYIELFNYIRDDIIKVENIDLIDNILYCFGHKQTFTYFRNGVISNVDKSVKYEIDKKQETNGVVTINNISYKLAVSDRMHGHFGVVNDILLNNKVICSVETNEGFTFDSRYKDINAEYNNIGQYGVEYILSISDKYLIHFYLYDEATTYCRFVLVLDKNGDIHDIFSLNGYEELFFDFKFSPKSTIFRTKYKTIFREKY